MEAMKFSLIICTYMRPQTLMKLLRSVKFQTLYPNEIFIIDGSLNTKTELMLFENQFANLKYYKVDESNRGLTLQRNFGISKVAVESEVVCFLDDDTVLEPDYFEQLIKTFSDNPEITGVGGVAVNENRWRSLESGKEYSRFNYYFLDGYCYKESQRNVVRNLLSLQSNLGPGKMPEYSHGRTTGFPLNGKIYEVDLLIGMSMAFRKRVVDSISFSPYFEGYGLYEDADFSVRALQFGKNVINTNLRLNHYHDPSGRPNQYAYGKMVVRNGWYVWRVKNPKPSFKARFKWHAITLLLTAVRWSNVITTNKRKQAFTEALGRTVAWVGLLVDKPKL